MSDSYKQKFIQLNQVSGNNIFNINKRSVESYSIYKKFK